MAAHRRLFRRERGGRHARLGVGFQQEQPVQPTGFIPAEIGPADTATAKRAMGDKRHFHAGVKNGLGQIGRHHMARAAGLVFRVVTLPAIGDDVGHGQRSGLARPVAHDRTGQFAPRQISLDHYMIGHRGGQLRRRIRPFGHEIDTDR